MNISSRHTDITPLCKQESLLGKTLVWLVKQTFFYKRNEKKIQDVKLKCKDREKELDKDYS